MYEIRNAFVEAQAAAFQYFPSYATLIWPSMRLRMESDVSE